MASRWPTSTLQCAICHEDIKDPRMLPCIHSFCLECLKQYCRDKLPGDDMPCPACRSEFQIPKTGVTGLPVRVHDKDSASVSRQGREKSCEKHQDHPITMYCYDCKVSVCAMCCCEDHKPHKFERIEKVVEEVFGPIDVKLEEMKSRTENLRKVAAKTEAERIMMLKNAQAIELEVKKKSQDVVEKFTKLVERQTDEVLRQLQSQKSAAEKEIRSHRDTLQLALTEMGSFRTSSLELRSTGLPSEITQAAGDVLKRAKELLETHAIPSEYYAPYYTFTPVNIGELIPDDHNFVGQVNEFRYSAARVIEKISTLNWVLGVTSVDDEVFMLLSGEENQVAVYSINDYRLLRHLTVPGYQPNVDSDMTSCARRKYIFMSNVFDRCIRRYDLRAGIIRWMFGSHISKWSVPGKPVGLSVTDSGNLLVTCCEPNTLVELRGDSGQCVRELALQSDISDPWHGVQLTDSQFVVCHGHWPYTIHRVSVMDEDGKVAHSYGGQWGSDVGQLRRPCHLAMDKDSQFVFVSDRGNGRIVLISPTLEFVRYVIKGLSCPYRLYFHQSTRRLFVGQWFSDVMVIQL